jgi:Aspartyl/Asparaginyl beta-hydroxylase
VNVNARRHLPWVLNKAVNHKGNELERVSQAVRQGPLWSQNNDHDRISPVLGQYPTVLLMHGLIAHQPLVTWLHPYVEAVFGHDKIMLRQCLFTEYIAAQTDQISWLQNDVQEGEWKVLHLLYQGVWQKQHCQKCPTLASVIQQLQPHVMDKCLFGNVFVSVLQPGTMIEPHCGPNNVRHHLHYALQVPDDDYAAAKLTVIDKQQTWKEGHYYFVFDDSFTHSVVYPATNQSSEKQGASRVVLIVDLWHPQCSQLERKVITELYSAQKASMT